MPWGSAHTTLMNTTLASSELHIGAPGPPWVRGNTEPWPSLSISLNYSSSGGKASVWEDHGKCSASTTVVGPRKVQQVRSVQDEHPQGMKRAGRRNQGMQQQRCRLELLLRPGKLAPPQEKGRCCSQQRRGKRPVAVVSIGIRSRSLGGESGAVGGWEAAPSILRDRAAASEIPLPNSSPQGSSRSLSSSWKAVSDPSLL